MKRSYRLAILSIVALIGVGIPAAYSQAILEQVKDEAAKATVAAALISFFGVIFGTIFSEVSSYYKDRALGLQKKWEVIFPLIKDFYYPWIQSAYYVSDYLKNIETDSISPEQAARLMFYLSLFYTKRLNLSIRAGARPILAEEKDEEDVLEEYTNVENSLQFGGPDTRTRVSFLQGYFDGKDKPDKPYTSHDFIEDVTKAAPDSELARIHTEVQEWFSQKRATAAAKELDEFQDVFKKGINKLYTGWVS